MSDGQGSVVTSIAAVGAAVVLLVLIVAAGAGAGLASLLSGGDEAPSAAAAAIPTAMLELYEEAAGSCPGLPWTVLAAIGTIESDNGTSNLPGVHVGANPAGAEGPMQFVPATFAAYDEPVPPGGADPPSPYDATDAVYAAARLLCANGARDGTDLDAAIFDYDHNEAYVAEVLSLAAQFGQAPTLDQASAPSIALDYALAQVGTPYRWGGETPGVAFDCSGLVQAAYAAAGVHLPRVAQDQYDGTVHLGPDDPIEPGDLLFFGGGPHAVTHVGLYVAPSQMVDAPHIGADVRVESYGGWDDFVGASVAR